jgi:CRISPR/Cas system-associated protein endoribonuclease Cas2
MAAAKQHSAVVGVFQDRQQANKAVSELLKAGFRQDQIGVAMRHAKGRSGRPPQPKGRPPQPKPKARMPGQGR